jgi:hypothetical protein
MKVPSKDDIYKIYKNSPHFVCGVSFGLERGSARGSKRKKIIFYINENFDYTVLSQNRRSALPGKIEIDGIYYETAVVSFKSPMVASCVSLNADLFKKLNQRQDHISGGILLTSTFRCAVNESDNNQSSEPNLIFPRSFGTFGGVFLDNKTGTLVGLTAGHVLVENIINSYEQFTTNIDFIKNTSDPIFIPEIKGTRVIDSEEFLIEQYYDYKLTGKNSLTSVGQEAFILGKDLWIDRILDSIGKIKRYSILSALGSSNTVDAGLISLKREKILLPDSLYQFGTLDTIGMPFATESEIISIFENSLNVSVVSAPSGPKFKSCDLIIDEVSVTSLIDGYNFKNSFRSILFNDLIKISRRIPDDTVFAPGDSGSIVYARVDGVNKIIGMVIAVNGKHAYVSKITNIAQQLDISPVSYSAYNDYYVDRATFRKELTLSKNSDLKSFTKDGVLYSQSGLTSFTRGGLEVNRGATELTCTLEKSFRVQSLLATIKTSNTTSLVSAKIIGSINRLIKRAELRILLKSSTGTSTEFTVFTNSFGRFEIPNLTLFDSEIINSCYWVEVISAKKSGYKYDESGEIKTTPTCNSDAAANNWIDNGLTVIDPDLIVGNDDDSEDEDFNDWLDDNGTPDWNIVDPPEYDDPIEDPVYPPLDPPITDPPITDTKDPDVPVCPEPPLSSSSSSSLCSILCFRRSKYDPVNGVIYYILNGIDDPAAPWITCEEYNEELSIYPDSPCVEWCDKSRFPCEPGPTPINSSSSSSSSGGGGPSSSSSSSSSIWVGPGVGPGYPPRPSSGGNKCRLHIPCNPNDSDKGVRIGSTDTCLRKRFYYPTLVNKKKPTKKSDITVIDTGDCKMMVVSAVEFEWEIEYLEECTVGTRSWRANYSNIGKLNNQKNEDPGPQSIGDYPFRGQNGVYNLQSSATFAPIWCRDTWPMIESVSLQQKVSLWFYVGGVGGAGSQSMQREAGYIFGDISFLANESECINSGRIYNIKLSSPKSQTLTDIKKLFCSRKGGPLLSGDGPNNLNFSGEDAKKEISGRFAVFAPDGMVFYIVRTPKDGSSSTEYITPSRKTRLPAVITPPGMFNYVVEVQTEKMEEGDVEVFAELAVNNIVQLAKDKIRVFKISNTSSSSSSSGEPPCEFGSSIIDEYEEETFDYSYT